MFQGQPLHPLKHYLQLFTDISKEGWGAHLINHTASRKQATYKVPGTKGGLFGPKRVPRTLPEQHSSYSHRQHPSGCPFKQRIGNEIGPSVCPYVENADIVYQQTGYSQSQTHFRLVECGSRQAIQARPDN